MSPVILWFRHDLRLRDNPALSRAAASGRPIVALYVLDEETTGVRPLGGALKWWLHHSLAALAAALGSYGVQLVLRRGPAHDALLDVITQTGAGAVFWNRVYGPHEIARDGEIKSDLQTRGLQVHSDNGSLIREPWEVATQQGKPYFVFTPFWKATRAKGDPPAPLDAPADLAICDANVASDRLEDWALLPHGPNWAAGLEKDWQPGEARARDQLMRFLDNGLARYATDRDRPATTGSSRLSPHLRFGEIGPRQIWHWTLDHARGHGFGEDAAWSFLRELGWRDFNHNLLFHRPEMPERNLKSPFDAFPWRDNRDDFKAWQRGITGYPVVDAGMRELWHTGWMHNRVRMITASFLIKHLLLPWQWGEAWFWDTLVDADLANNTGNWQWVAGSGADAAPYFRIFNPVLQGEKFDADGVYVRRWIPELTDLPSAYIHKPWGAPPAVLATAGIALGETYPLPLVNHAQARARALAAYNDIKKGAA